MATSATFGFAASMLLAAALATAGAAPARIRRCEAADGAIAYQATPCPDGVRETWSLAFAADAPAAAAVPPTVAAGGARAAPRGGTGRRPRGTGRSAPSASARADAAARLRCEHTRAEAQHLRETMWNRLDFRARSALDARVAADCGQ